MQPQVPTARVAALLPSRCTARTDTGTNYHMARSGVAVGDQTETHGRGGGYLLYWSARKAAAPLVASARVSRAADHAACAAAGHRMAAGCAARTTYGAARRHVGSKVSQGRAGNGTKQPNDKTWSWPVHRSFQPEQFILFSSARAIVTFNTSNTYAFYYYISLFVCKQMECKLNC